MKMLDFCLEIDSLSAKTGYTIPKIIEEIKKCENQLADVTMVTSIPFEYVCRKYVMSDFDLYAVRPAIIKAEFSQKSSVSKMNELATRFIAGQISRDEYFSELEKLRKERGA